MFCVINLELYAVTEILLCQISKRIYIVVNIEINMLFVSNKLYNYLVSNKKENFLYINKSK